MSTKAWQKIDVFFPLMVVVMLLLAALVIFTFRAVFSAVLIAYEPEEDITESELRIDKGKLDDSYKAAFEKEKLRLEVR